MTQEFRADYSKWIEYLDQLGYRKVVTCKDCKHSEECLQGVVIDDTYVPTEWCSQGERKTEE